MRVIRRLYLLLFVLVSITFLSNAATAQQINSNQYALALAYNSGEQLTLNVVPPANPTVFSGFPPTAGPIVVNASGSFSQLRQLSIYAYFASGNALSDGNGNFIGSSQVLGSSMGGSGIPFNGPSPYSNFSRLLFQQGLSGDFSTPNADLSLSFSAPASIPAGNYSGTLFFQAQAI